MDLKTVIVLLIAAAASYFLLVRSRGDLSAADARALVANGALLLDVRTPAEYASGHIEGAVNIPVDQLSSRLSELPDRDRPIVLYCASGARSARATELLSDAGYEQAHNLGGFGRW